MTGVTITPEPAKLVDTVPTKSNLRQIVVTGAGAPAIDSVIDLTRPWDRRLRRDGQAPSYSLVTPYSKTHYFIVRGVRRGLI